MKIDAEYVNSLSQGFYKEDETERRKLEAKSKWYILTKKEDIEEFCKDITAIANTPGPEGYIIIGVDEKNGTITHSPLIECGLTDESLLHDIIIRRVKPPPQFELEQINLHDGKIVDLIKIPPSLEKPHVIGLYKNIQCFIPVRHGTKIVPANHADLEFMYYDRKNIEPDYRIGFLLNQRSLAFNEKSLANNDKALHTTVNFLLQNTGRHPVAISSASLIFELRQPTHFLSQLESQIQIRNWIGDTWLNPNEKPQANFHSLNSKPIIIPYNSLIELRMDFYSDSITLQKTSSQVFSQARLELGSVAKFSYTLILNSANGRTFTSDQVEVDSKN